MFKPPVVFSTDRSKAVVPVLVLTLCCFMVYSTRRYVVCLSVCHFVLVFFCPFSIAITSLGEERANLKTHTTDLKMGVSALLRLFISSIGPVLPKEMEYNLYYGDVRGDVLPPPHGTNTSCSVVK